MLEQALDNVKNKNLIGRKPKKSKGIPLTKEQKKKLKDAIKNKELTLQEYKQLKFGQPLKAGSVDYGIRLRKNPGLFKKVVRIVDPLVYSKLKKQVIDNPRAKNLVIKLAKEGKDNSEILEELKKIGVNIKDEKFVTARNKIANLVNRLIEAGLVPKQFERLAASGLTPLQVSNKEALIEKELNKKQIPSRAAIARTVGTSDDVVEKYVRRTRGNKFYQKNFNYKIGKLKAGDLGLQKAVADYILDNDNISVKGISKEFGMKKNKINNLMQKIIYQVYKENILRDLDPNDPRYKKFGKSIYLPTDPDLQAAILTKIKNAEDFEDVYYRRVGTLINEAYPVKGKSLARKRARQYYNTYLKLNQEIAKKFPTLKTVLDHPVSFDLLKKVKQDPNPENYIRIRPLPARINTFKIVLDTQIRDALKALQKNSKDKKALQILKDVNQVADAIDIDVGQYSKTGKVLSFQAQPLGKGNILEDIKKAAKRQNLLSSIVEDKNLTPALKNIFSAKLYKTTINNIAKIGRVDEADYKRTLKEILEKNPNFKNVLSATQKLPKGASPGFGTLPAILALAGISTIGYAGKAYAANRPKTPDLSPPEKVVPEMERATPGPEAAVGTAIAGASFVPKAREVTEKILEKIPKPVKKVGGALLKRVILPYFVGESVYDVGTKAQYETPGEMATTIAKQPLEFAGLGFLADKAKENLRIKRYATPQELQQLNSSGIMDYYSESPSQTNQNELEKELLARARRMEFGQAGEFRPDQIDAYQDTGDEPVYRIPEATKRYLKRQQQGIGAFEDIYGP